MTGIGIVLLGIGVSLIFAGISGTSMRALVAHAFGNTPTPAVASGGGSTKRAV